MEQLAARRDMRASTRRVECAFVAPGRGGETRPRALRCASSARHRGHRPRVERLRRVRTRASGERGARTARSRARGSLVEEVSGRRIGRRGRVRVEGRGRRRGRDGERGAHLVQEGVRPDVRQQGDAGARARDATRPTPARLAPPFSPHPHEPTRPTSRPSLTPLPPTQVVMLGLDAAGKTTILYKLHIGEVLSTVPTLGTPDLHPLARVVDTRARSRTTGTEPRGFALLPRPRPSSHVSSPPARPCPVSPI